MRHLRPIRRARSFLSAPLRRYLDARFDSIDARLETLAAATAPDPLASIEVGDQNDGAAPPTFTRLVSQVVSARQFADPNFVRLSQDVYPDRVVLPTGDSPGFAPHRKVWEFMYVLRAAEQHGLLGPGRKALGFGVGTEPLPAAFAKHGVTVLATDQESAGDTAGDWTSTGQHLSSLHALSRPEIVGDDALRELVDVRYVDMNAIPRDLGTFDVVWSCCALEHLGSPSAGMTFLRNTLPLLSPGGISVHTTEFELTARKETADYGNLAVYRREDLDELTSSVRELGFAMETNWYVALETPIDRHVSVPPHTDAHLKLALGESVSTSVGLLIRRPDGDGVASE